MSKITIISDAEGASLIPALIVESGIDPSIVRVQSYKGISYNQIQVLKDLGSWSQEAIICLGTSALGVLAPHRRDDKIGRLRDADDIEWNDVPVYTTYSTKFLEKRGGRGTRDFLIVASDLKRFASTLNGKEEKFKYELFEAHQTYDFLEKFIDAPVVALDYEGSSLHPTIEGFQVAGVGLAKPGYAAYLCFKDFGNLDYALSNEYRKVVGKFLAMKNRTGRVLVFNLDYEVPTTQVQFNAYLDRIWDVMQECRTLDITGGLKEISKQLLGVTGWTKGIDKWLNVANRILAAMKPTVKHNKPEYAPFMEGGLRKVLEFLQEKEEKGKGNTRTEAVRQAIQSMIEIAEVYYKDEAIDKIDAFIKYKLERKDYECNYSEIPKELIGPYCGADCHYTLEVHDIIFPKLEEQNLVQAFEYYNRQSYLGSSMTQNGIVWDDSIAQKIESEYNGSLVEAHRGFLLAEQVYTNLRVKTDDKENPYRKLSPQDLLDIQATTDLEVLKKFFNPDSTAPANTKVLGEVLVTPFTRVALMMQELGTSYQSEPESCLKRFPHLCELIAAIYQIPKEKRGKQTLQKFLKAFAILRKQGLLNAAEESLYYKYSSYQLESSDADTIQTLLDAYLSFTGLDLNSQETWIPEAFPLFYYKLYKKISKVLSSFLNGAQGRKSVRIVREDQKTGKYIRLAHYGDREVGDKELLVFEPAFGVNRAKTKRWTSAYHGIPPMSESKKCFTSRFGENGIFLKGDFSQHELRIIAALCQDPGLQKAFLENRDLHRMVGSEVYGKPEDEVTDNERANAKSANFGIVYLKTPESFAADYLNGDVDQARLIFNTIFGMFPKLREWRDEQLARLHEIIANSPSSYIRFPIYTLWGDPIFHEFDMNSRMGVIDAERYAVNWQVQSTASNLCALAAAETDAFLTENNYKSKIFGFTHDCEEFDVVLDELFLMLTKVPEVSEQYLFDQFKLPVKLDIEIGTSLGQLVGISRAKGNSTFFDENGDAHIILDGELEDADLVIDRLSNRYKVNVLSESRKESFNNWSDIFSLKGCYFSSMGKKVQKVKREIQICRG